MSEFIICFGVIYIISFGTFAMCYTFMSIQMDLNLDTKSQTKIFKILLYCFLYISVIVTGLYYLELQSNEKAYKNVKQDVLEVVKEQSENGEYPSTLYDDINKIFENIN